MIFLQSFSWRPLHSPEMHWSFFPLETDLAINQHEHKICVSQNYYPISMYSVIKRQTNQTIPSYQRKVKTGLCFADILRVQRYIYISRIQTDIWNTESVQIPCSQSHLIKQAIELLTNHPIYSLRNTEISHLCLPSIFLSFFFFFFQTVLLRCT